MMIHTSDSSDLELIHCAQAWFLEIPTAGGSMLYMLNTCMGYDFCIYRHLMVLTPYYTT